ncbi:SWI/SNF complex subunit SWI3A isoform X2 [Canna indica]|uniref:SWI/SNF complex subunit SWI3A isoform X2 n=1 Tax=Canna indica TaxID=4628 RepID=A0AAQ3Q8W4_9LILI|nr:SWI/SNF complex subunit SWI3A isoform X2 [Canna indica]
MPPSSEGSDLADRELYSIPASSSWFRWDEIHETERQSLPEFFDGSAASRNPRVYKEYRDFIISKYREDPSKHIAFTEVRKSLIGDIGYLHKVFRCLEKWGLINFGAKASLAVPSSEEDVGPKVVVEEGAPTGVQVVPACIPQRKRVRSGTSAGGGENGFKLPPLTSYTDVFGDWAPKGGPVCGVCGQQSASGGSESLERGLAICSKCSKDKSQADCNTSENLKPEADDSTNHTTTAWTDAETLLLLEAVLKHGDDWDLISQHVRTKDKLDCIARLIQLPFGEHLLSSMNGTFAGSSLINQSADVKNELPQEPMKADGHIEADEKDALEESIEEKPPKRRCFPSFVHAADSLIKQVACLSTVAGPQVAAAAAEAGVTALCSENPSARNAFYINEDPKNGLTYASHDANSCLKTEEQDIEFDKETDTSEHVPLKRFGSTAFQVRAAMGTALGAAAARAKLLADQEEREMELLLASIVEAQLRKIQYKIKHFEELELMMEKEYALLEKAKESILEEWIMLLENTFKAGIPRWRDTPLPKPFFNTSTI